MRTRTVRPRARSSEITPNADPPGRLLRCFVAAFLTAGSAGRLRAAALDCLPRRVVLRGREVPLQNYHVTLKFLGALAPGAVADARAAVAELTATGSCADALTVTGFPRPARARLVAVELQPQPQLEAWWAALEARLGREDRGFRPHVSIVRFRRPGRFEPVPLAEPLTVELAPPRLYRSDPAQDGVRYTPLDGS